MERARVDVFLEDLLPVAKQTIFTMYDIIFTFFAITAIIKSKSSSFFFYHFGTIMSLSLESMLDVSKQPLFKLFLYWSQINSSSLLCLNNSLSIIIIYYIIWYICYNAIFWFTQSQKQQNTDYAIKHVTEWNISRIFFHLSSYYFIKHCLRLGDVLGVQRVNINSKKIYENDVEGTNRVLKYSKMSKRYKHVSFSTRNI